jgi:hypothetical protein
VQLALSSQLCNMEDCTPIEIDVHSLATHQVAPDGSDICLNIENAGGRPICVKGAELLRRAAGPEVDATHAEPEAQYTDRGGPTLPDHKRLEVSKALATEPRLPLLDGVMAAGSSRLRLETSIKRSEE